MTGAGTPLGAINPSQMVASYPGTPLSEIVGTSGSTGERFKPVVPTAFTRPEDDLYFGTNPSDPAFGARVFTSEPDAGHLGYWEPGSAALDALAAIAVGRGDVIPR